MKAKSLSAIVLAAGLCTAGCDEGYEAGPVVPMQTDGVNVDVDTPDTPFENRVERRQERRNDIREAVDHVDVQFGDGGVSVDVD
ncbi:hypothetical protein [Rubripirellula reticaptiva]|uniref:Uncharacterized protein n=1 Tax=Rubripirellula reticaptiva TaxID=2528013 RepID=A0A5C6ECB0_9BACT|nr:hypothetical protein [Rubripirellula reticaptiva]TWU46528.1 hypothetical protein Poly59_55010 [Rubripirellula reticaptiva]